MGLPEIPPQEDSAPDDWVRREMEQRGIYNPLPGQRQEYTEWVPLQGPHPEYNPGPYHGRNHPPDRNTATPSPGSPEPQPNSWPPNPNQHSSPQPENLHERSCQGGITHEDSNKTLKLLDAAHMAGSSIAQAVAQMVETDMIPVVVNVNHMAGSSFAEAVKNARGNIITFPEERKNYDLPAIFWSRRAIVDAAHMAGSSIAEAARGITDTSARMAILNTNHMAGSSFAEAVKNARGNIITFPEECDNNLLYNHAIYREILVDAAHMAGSSIAEAAKGVIGTKSTLVILNSNCIARSSLTDAIKNSGGRIKAL